MSDHGAEQGGERAIRSIHQRMNALVNGLVGGTLTGGGLALATLVLVLKGGENVGAHLRLLDNFFIGYSVTGWGSLVGLVYGFLTGFLLCYGASRLYNLFLGLRARDRR